MRKTYLYFIQAGPKGPVKVGICCDIPRRLRTLQTAQYATLNFRLAVPCETRPLAAELEHYFHKCMKNRKLRIRGEWFQPECLEYVRKIVKHIGKAESKFITELPE